MNSVSLSIASLIKLNIFPSYLEPMHNQNEEKPTNATYGHNMQKTSLSLGLWATAIHN